MRKAIFTTASHTGIDFLLPLTSKIIYQISIAAFMKNELIPSVMMMSFKKGTGTDTSPLPDKCLFNSIPFKIR